MGALESDQWKHCTPSPGTPADAPGGVLTQHPQQAEGGQWQLLRVHGHGLLLPQPWQAQHPWVRRSGPRVSLSRRRGEQVGVAGVALRAAVQGPRHRV